MGMERRIVGSSGIYGPWGVEEARRPEALPHECVNNLADKRVHYVEGTVIEGDIKRRSPCGRLDSGVNTSE